MAYVNWILDHPTCAIRFPLNNVIKQHLRQINCKSTLGPNFDCF